MNEELHSLKSSTSTKTLKEPYDLLEKALVLVFVLVFAAPAFWLFGSVHQSWTTDEVVSTRSIGNFVSMSGPGGLQKAVVIETSLGSFPLQSAAAIAKGTPLILELRQSGQRYICDVQRSQCIRTDGPDFNVTPPSAKQ